MSLSLRQFSTASDGSLHLHSAALPRLYSRQRQRPHPTPVRFHQTRQNIAQRVNQPSCASPALLRHTTYDRSVGLGKYGSFQAKDLIGKPYGETYEITTTGGLIRVEATLTEIGSSFHPLCQISAHHARCPQRRQQRTTRISDRKDFKNSPLSTSKRSRTKEYLVESVYRLATLFVLILRLSFQDIIAKQIEEHSAYELKTEYSKDKYMKRKEAKSVVPSSLLSALTTNFQISANVYRNRADSPQRLPVSIRQARREYPRYQAGCSLANDGARECSAGRKVDDYRGCTWIGR